jgi:hypothetical protein
VNEHYDVMCQVRESFSGLRMDMPVEDVLARSRARRRRLLAGLTAAPAAAAAGAAAAAVTLTLGGPAPARPHSPLPPTPGTARLAAFSVTDGPGLSTTLILHKGPQYPRLDPTALRQALAQHGIPALVTTGTFCRDTPGAPADPGKATPAPDQADGSAIVINGRAIPPGTRLSIGLFPGHTRMALIKDGAPLSCSSTSRQPTARITPTGTPIRVSAPTAGDVGRGRVTG